MQCFCWRVLFDFVVFVCSVVVPVGGPRKYAQGNSSADLYTLYAAATCSPYLSDQQCSNSLMSVTGDLKPGCSEGYAGFFNSIPAAPFPSPSPETGNKSSSKVWVAVGISAPSAVLIGVAIFLTLKWKRNPRQIIESRPDEDEDEVVLESPRYNLDTITDATDNFSEANKLGQGGFGSVFLGTLPNGQQIAVKQLSKDSGQGQTEFKNEVVLLARLQHKNLVRLLGFCLESGERLLVYEFLPNLSLDWFIFDPLKRGSLRWDIRHKIITGIAQGLLYLHEESGHRIVHRDLKASNVLLDGDMNPKLSDFGMARLFKIGQTQADTSRIVGTHGYMAPEYITQGQFSIKSYVFSFGVLVLETVSGRRNLSFQVGEHREVLISRVWRNWCEGKISSIIDPLVKTGYTLDIVSQNLP
ncbi:hypothetical protein MLD38_036906 [Melastoma candidum]|uniref:Uncharacterized protein n=1 Tax=Melastoma candidum TaxID=119954 RepID=A0ACB9LMY1_9MYRT|nr:hypothetical protein MLD38_036906 [Melastoma candidum]